LAKALQACLGLLIASISPVVTKTRGKTSFPGPRAMVDRKRSSRREEALISTGRDVNAYWDYEPRNSPLFDNQRRALEVHGKSLISTGLDQSLLTSAATMDGDFLDDVHTLSSSGFLSDPGGSGWQ
jgi:hypothetical protein